MEVLLILLTITSIILLVTLLDRISEHRRSITSLEKSIRDLTEQVRKFSANEEQSSTSQKAQIIEKPQKIIPTTVIQAEKIEAPITVNLQITKEETTQTFITQPAAETFQASPPAPPRQPGWWEEWLKNNRDLEKFIGENLANKIGIAVLVLGISFFVKYAIDKEWINEIGRVIIGLVAGGLLVGLAHRTRNSYRSFSSVLVGGGLTVFYFTIAFAFHQYHLLSQQAAFFIMVLITAFAVGLALLYDRMELAVLATLGGFITPFLVSTGQANYVALFTYLAILNAGLMVLSLFKKWPAINFIALFFTTLIYGGWLTRTTLGNNAIPIRHAISFASIFYVQFLLMNILNNLVSKRKFGAFDFIVVFSVNSLYYAAGMLILQQWNNGDYRGLFTAILGLLNLGLAWYFFHRRQMDRNFVYLLIGLTISFISLAAPVQLKGNYITLFWTAEAVVLFWLFQRSRIKLVKIFSLLVLGAMFVSLLMDWDQVYFSSDALPVMVNRGFVTNIIVALSMFIYYAFMRKEADSYFLNQVTNQAFRGFLLYTGVIILFMAGALETWFQFSHHFPDTTVYVLYLELYTFLFANVLLLFIRKGVNFRITITSLCIVVYLLSMKAGYDNTFDMLHSGLGKGHFWARWISDIFFAKLLIDLALFVKNNIVNLRREVASFTWFISITFVLFLSMEMFLVVLWINGASAVDWAYWENLYMKAGLSITWGVCAFIMMWLGMRFNNKTLRVISLTLILITLAKLFLNDIRNIPAGGKIAAFILLGVLLLIISFMYQRLKKIIIDDKVQEK